MKTKMFSTRLDEKLRKSIKVHCKRTNQKIQGFLEKALKTELKSQLSILDEGDKK